MNKLLRDVWEALRSPMIVFTLLMGIILSSIIILLDYWWEPDLKGVLVEAHGLIFDLLLFGILLGVYDIVLRRRNERIREQERIEDLVKRYMEEIDDYRGWKSEEAMFRTVGNLKRLNGLGISRMDLCNCYLSKANLRTVNLSYATMREVRLVEADLRKALLQGADLQLAYLNGANLNNAQLAETNLNKSTLVNANLQHAQLYRANLSESRLANADLSDANLQEANCRGCDFSYASLKDADLRNADLREADLGDADLRGAQITGCQFEGADLRDAIFGEAQRSILTELGIQDLKEVRFLSAE
ncbi:MAG: pentapeptide repeat-containing protein [Bacteroidota bacterium]